MSEMRTIFRPASRRTITTAVAAAAVGTATSIKATPWMDIQAALAMALDLIEEGPRPAPATAYVTGDLLYVGPRNHR